MKKLVILFGCFIFISCSSKNIYQLNDCEWSAGRMIQSEKEAKEIAFQYLDNTDRNDKYYKDSVSVIFSEDIYELRIKRKDNIKPSIYLLHISKEDGCVQYVPLR